MFGEVQTIYEGFLQQAALTLLVLGFFAPWLYLFFQSQDERNDNIYNHGRIGENIVSGFSWGILRKPVQWCLEHFGRVREGLESAMPAELSG